MMRSTFMIFLFCLTGLTNLPAQGNIYLTQQGQIRFRSDAPQEILRAASKELKGAIDIQNKSFTFKIRISSFEGFNSPLQRTHFNENYMESAVYPEATFKGKIIEDIDWNTPGTYTVRAKGLLTVHGVEQERIIRGTLTIAPRQLSIKSSFTIFLSDHNIPIPRIVKEKLAQEITLDMECVMLLRQ